MADIEDVLAYWFGHLQGDVTAENKRSLWFKGSEEIDREITERFRDLVSQAGRGELNAWTETPRGTLALLILLDQFSRNIYRGLAAAFRYDSLAQALCKRGLAKNFDRSLTPIEQAFFYMPLEHSEALEDQEESVFRFDQLRQSVPAEHKAVFDDFYQYAVSHYQVIKDFGRFPHRNAACGRLSTRDEISYLQTAHRFGQ
ncbi:DUF924 domain-containing protein [Photobacterium sp. CCB-ST2H9]|uniref:DUF924 family protein n=1 Tax=unclassified Photobacterium TaxID=2628852 RepID=UPI002005C981|nr:DUF924 family protein [Photobacterium sp. CCB-ST2H9]UTM56382.1 DUF924 domain-containing protein [Photobacterium sp. CCB-ST2H9]